MWPAAFHHFARVSVFMQMLRCLIPVVSDQAPSSSAGGRGSLTGDRCVGGGSYKNRSPSIAFLTAASPPLPPAAVRCLIESYTGRSVLLTAHHHHTDHPDCPLCPSPGPHPSLWCPPPSLQVPSSSSLSLVSSFLSSVSSSFSPGPWLPCVLLQSLFPRPRPVKMESGGRSR